MSVITESYSMPLLDQFNDQYKHKYFCEVVQGQVSNDVRQERSAAVMAGTVLPTGSIGYINENGVAVNTLAGSSTTAAIPYIVTVGTEHGNVFSEKYNSGCGLITMIPLTVGNDIMTTVLGGTTSAFAPNTKVVVGSTTIEGSTVSVGAIAPATGAPDEVVVGVVRSAGKYHAGVDGVVFSTAFSL